MSRASRLLDSVEAACDAKLDPALRRSLVGAIDGALEEAGYAGAAEMRRRIAELLEVRARGGGPSDVPTEPVELRFLAGCVRAMEERLGVTA